VIQGLIGQQFPDHQLEIIKSRDGIRMDYQELFSAMDRETALLTLSHVAFKSAFMYDMARVNSDADNKGIPVIWDLSHAAGAVPVELNKNNAHMAVGCTYKYLNGGPGAPAFLYVSRELQEKLSNPVWSWFSHSRAFDFDLAYEPHTGIQKFACGTPQVLSMAAIEPGLDILIEAGIENIRKKSLGLTNFLVEMVKEYLEPLGFSLASPLNEEERGSHISVQHPDAYRINRAMIEPLDKGWVVIPDFRPPNNIRLGVTPLYTSYSDLFFAVKRMAEIVEKGEFKRFGEEKLRVT
jgi:kynureninase